MCLMEARKHHLLPPPTVDGSSVTVSQRSAVCLGTKSLDGAVVRSEVKPDLLAKDNRDILKI